MFETKDSAENVYDSSNVSSCAVHSYNEWDPLEEVIVGHVEGAAVPPWHVTLEATMPPDQRDFFLQRGGQPFPAEHVAAARQELEELVHILTAEGVKVRRPAVIDFTKSYSTLHWSSASGLYAAMPRDVILVIGTELIEAPMCWRSRYHEIDAYRPLIKEYFLGGARWTAAPKPLLTDDLYVEDYREEAVGDAPNFAINEHEPVFDAAEFIRCGKDIFVQKSHVTNSFGIEWLRQHLGDAYTIHELQFNDTHPMHIDGTFMPLAPGKLLVHPDRVPEIPSMFKHWDVLYAPPPTIPDHHTLYMASKWLNLNILMLDEKRVIVEKHDEQLITSLKKWGMEPIRCNFRNFNRFGGSFHCATLDIRRRGTLQSYF